MSAKRSRAQNGSRLELRLLDNPAELADWRLVERVSFIRSGRAREFHAATSRKSSKRSSRHICRQIVLTIRDFPSRSADRTSRTISSRKYLRDGSRHTVDSKWLQSTGATITTRTSAISNRSPTIPAFTTSASEKFFRSARSQ